MTIAIHNRSGSFSDRWIEYCNQNTIDYKIVNCYDNDIVEQLSGCSAFMWHFHHNNPKDVLFAKQLMFALEQTGMKTFPDFNTMWHFDDKVGQKYLLEAIGAPMVKSYVFYDKQEALDWTTQTTFPKVFKLRGGSASSNVKLVKSKSKAQKLIRQAFSRGFKQRNVFADLKERIRKFKERKGGLIQMLGGFIRLVKPHDYEKVKGIERGYVYFQDFIPNNEFDIRIIVIDKKAFAIKRMTRKNDFRASGSGDILYKKENFNNHIIDMAFEIADKLQTQCCVFDFVYDENNNPLIVEISYGFTINGYEPCPGYWDESLNFHEGHFNPYGWMVESVLRLSE